MLINNDARTAQMRHDIRYIYWYREAEKKQVSWEEWNEIVEHIKSEGREVPDVVGSRTLRSIWAKDKSYKFDDAAKDPIIYVSEIKNEKPTYSIYFTYLDAEKAKRPKGAGTDGFNFVNRSFIEKYGISMEKAFGRFEVKDGKTMFDKCVSRVKYALYVRKSVKKQRLQHLYKADISSAWPHETRFDLPDYSSMTIKEGRVLPNEEYPIAYYINSGHIAEWNKYDTHDWLDNIWYQEIERQSRENFKPHKKYKTWETFDRIPDDEEKTVLFKISEYNLDIPIGELYDKKEDKTDIFSSMWYKAMVNAFIGYMRSNDYNKQHWMGHISALAYARATNRMLTMANILVKEGNFPIYMAIDSIIWVGKKSQLTSEKKLGAFVLEAENASGIIINQGQYCLEKDGQIIFEKHQGIDSTIYKNKDIKSLDDYIEQMGEETQTKTIYDNKEHIFVVRRTLNI